MNSSQPFVRAPLPERFCQLERLLHGMEARGLDGIVATTPCNVFYLSGFNGIAHKSDEPKPYAVVLSRHAPDHPVLLLADYYVSTLLSQPSWIKDVRSFRSVMLPLDLAARDDDLDRFLTHAGAGADWVQQTRKQFSNTIHLACRDALEGLGLAGHRVGFDDLRFGYQLAMDGLEVADAYDSIMYARCVKTAFEIGKLKEATRINRDYSLGVFCAPVSLGLARFSNEYH